MSEPNDRDRALCIKLMGSRESWMIAGEEDHASQWDESLLDIAAYREELQAAHEREKETLAIDYANSLEEMDFSFTNEFVALQAAHEREAEGLKEALSEADNDRRKQTATSVQLAREVEGLRAALEKAGNILCGLGHDQLWIDAALATSGSVHEPAAMTTSPVRCRECGHEWVAHYLTGIDVASLECPSCHRQDAEKGEPR